MAQPQMDGEAFVMKKFSGENICRVACYFTTMPDNDDGDIVSEVNGEKYLILDNKTLKIKGEMKRIGGWHKDKPTCALHNPPGSVLITLGLRAITVPAPSGLSTIFFQLNVNIETGRSFVTSLLVEERKRVRLVDQIELPIQNKSGNYNCDADLGGDGWYYIIFHWNHNGDKTALSLARVKADHTAQIKCEKLASQRLISRDWLGCVIKSGFIWYFKPKQMMKHSFNGECLDILALVPHNGQYPPSWGAESIDYGNYVVACFKKGRERSIWILNFITYEWINLLISFAIDIPNGIQGSAITPQGIIYLLGQTWSANASHRVGIVDILQCDAQKRLKQILDKERAAKAAVKNAPPPYTASASSSASSFPPPPAYHEVEVEEKMGSNAVDEEEGVTRL